MCTQSNIKLLDSIFKVRGWSKAWYNLICNEESWVVKPDNNKAFLYQSYRDWIHSSHIWNVPLLFSADVNWEHMLVLNGPNALLRGDNSSTWINPYFYCMEPIMILEFPGL